MFFGYGVGANGKGVFLHTIGWVLGDYCKTAAIETFTETKSDRHPTELARLHSARLVTATETESGRNWAEARIKMLTGGDVVTAHFMRQDDFEYLPQFKLFFSGNHKPGLRSVGEAMRRRVNMILFDVVIPKDERDPYLGEKLEDEGPGILQWMIDGCLDWQEQRPRAAGSRHQGDRRLFHGAGQLHGLDRGMLRARPERMDGDDAAVRVVEGLGRTARACVSATSRASASRWKRPDFVWKRKNKSKGYEGLRLMIEAAPHWQEDADEGGAAWCHLRSIIPAPRVRARARGVSIVLRWHQAAPRSVSPVRSVGVERGGKGKQEPERCVARA